MYEGGCLSAIRQRAYVLPRPSALWAGRERFRSLSVYAGRRTIFADAVAASARSAAGGGLAGFQPTAARAPCAAASCAWMAWRSTRGDTGL